MPEAPSVVAHDHIVVHRYSLRYEGCPGFNLMENALEPVILFIFVIIFALETDVSFSVVRHELSIQVSKLSVMHFEILKSQKLLLFRICNFL